jgi:PIN domain nuclease of toxin-antitoxin system
VREDRRSAREGRAASTWEVVVQAGLGELDLGGEVATVLGEPIVRMGWRILPVEQAHCSRVATLPEVEWTDASGSPRRHVDPFDRLLVAQALVEGRPIPTSDDQLDRSTVARVWQPHPRAWEAEPHVGALASPALAYRGPTAHGPSWSGATVLAFGPPGAVRPRLRGIGGETRGGGWRWR